MENFSTILQTVWRPAQKNSWGGGCINPPLTGRGLKSDLIKSVDLGKSANTNDFDLLNHFLKFLNDFDEFMFQTESLPRKQMGVTFASGC